MVHTDNHHFLLRRDLPSKFSNHASWRTSLLNTIITSWWAAMEMKNYLRISLVEQSVMALHHCSVFSGRVALASNTIAIV